MCLLDKVVAKLREYRVADLNVKFRDREVEVFKILQELTPGIVHVIFGPRGCGKTELARALTNASNDELFVVYIGYGEEEAILRSYVVIPEREVAQSLVNMFRDMLESVDECLGIFKLVIRGLVTIYDIVRHVKDILDRKTHKQYILVVDEFRRRDTSIESVRQTLEIDANIIRDMNVEIRERTRGAACLKVMYLSSDATVQELQLKVGSKCEWWLMWYLPKDAFADILREITCPHDLDLMWTLTGGNLREVSALARINWKIEVWIDRMCDVMTGVLYDYIRTRDVEVSKVLREICEIVNDIDSAPMYPLWDYLVKYNVTMYVDARFLKISMLPHEFWIGRRCAFQLPVYYWILNAISSKSKVDVCAQDVLRIMKKCF